MLRGPKVPISTGWSWGPSWGEQVQDRQAVVTWARLVGLPVGRTGQVLCGAMTGYL